VAGEVETVLAFPGPRDLIRRATAYRSTWVVSSLQTLRERGHFDRYDRALRTHREEILGTVAGVWLPMAVARAHYEACEAVGLDADEQFEMGLAVGDRAQGSVLATVVKTARGAGVTPWTILPLVDRLWRRGANAGAGAVFRLGPKEARVEFVGCELFDIPYFRHAFRGVLYGIVARFCTKQYVHDVAPRPPGEAIFRLQWV
jgi:hypothetical protein